MQSTVRSVILRYSLFYCYIILSFLLWWIGVAKPYPIISKFTILITYRIYATIKHPAF